MVNESMNLIIINKNFITVLWRQIQDKIFYSLAFFLITKKYLLYYLFTVHMEAGFNLSHIMDINSTTHDHGDLLLIQNGRTQQGQLEL